ncbi:MAG: hypothetical protein RR248_02845 [Clostridia bacterium]
MEYDKCRRCEINYKPKQDEYCSVCLAELKGEFYEEDSDLLCPFCYKNKLDFDEIMCKRCWLKRHKEQDYDK